jgi:hypothetical protein
MSAKQQKYVAPLLSRATTWTAERIGTLPAAEVRLLRDNALRLEEPEIAALCELALTKLRREVLAARKALPQKPRKAPVPKVVEE